MTFRVFDADQHYYEAEDCLTRYASKRMQAHDQAPFRHLGIEPSEQKILALKSTVHFRADFQPIAEAVLVAVAPGGHIVDPTQYAYKRLRKGVRLYPLGPEFGG